MLRVEPTSYEYCGIVMVGLSTLFVSTSKDCQNIELQHRRNGSSGSQNSAVRDILDTRFVSNYSIGPFHWLCSEDHGGQDLEKPGSGSMVYVKSLLFFASVLIEQ